jgi:hypothetical protein
MLVDAMIFGLERNMTKI